MAKISMIQRDIRRKKIVQRFSKKRKELKDVIKNIHSSDEEKRIAMSKLHKQPRDASASRIRNRCQITGRPHGFYRKFGLCRNQLREAAMRGDVPGLVKASW